MSETAIIWDSARVQPGAKWFATGAGDSWFGRSYSWPGGRGRCLTGDITLLASVGAAWPLAHHGGHSSAKWTQRRL